MKNLFWVLLLTFVGTLCATAVIFAVEQFWAVTGLHAVDSIWFSYTSLAIQTILIFGFPVLIFRRFVASSSFKFIQSGLSFTALSFGFLAWILCFLPVNALWEFNKSIVFPESLAWLEQVLRSSQQQTESFLNNILQYRGGIHTVILIIVVAGIPAIIEELFFRGLIQQLLHKITGRIWVPVVIASAIFSIFHFDFYAFLPRVLLGIMLGIAFVSTGNILLPIILHFINNVSNVLMHQFVSPESIELISQIGFAGYQWILSVLSFVLLLYILKLMLRLRLR